MSAAARAGADKVPFLRTSNVLWDEIDLAVVDAMAIPEYELTEKCLEPGDLLVCEGGEIGRAAIWEGGAEPMSFQNHLHRLRPKVDDVDPRFYVYFLQSAFTQLGIFEGAGNKTTIPNLSSGRLKALDVPHPPLPEQAAIADALRYVQTVRRLNARLIAMTEELKAAAMQQLFSAGLRGTRRRSPRSVRSPSWELRSIPDLCDISSGGTPKKSVAEYWSGDIPWVSGKDLKRPALEDATDHVSQDGVDNGSRLAPADSVLLLVRGMGLAKDLPVAVITRPMAFNQDVKALVSKDGYSGSFLRSAVYAGKDRLLSQLATSAHGTKTLNLNDLSNFVVPTPPTTAEADEIAEVLETLDRKIDIHRRKGEVLDQLFKSLLHKLMTGEVSVDDLDLSALPKPEGRAA
ncbi:MAG: restriction endonuclease subunit S [Nocardioidaceae bacterium]|nr:MAG: restriction endonuclease subunit S [Nocardioidaceae bacterium]